jgi:nicotinamidase-related amidase
MQKLERPKFQKKEWERLVSSIQALADIVRAVRIPIVHIFLSERSEKNHGPYRYDPNQNPFDVDGKGIFERELFVSECFPVVDEWIYRKSDSGAFDREDFLKNVSELSALQNLVLAGVHTYDCVYQTALGARQFSYNVLLPYETTDAFSRASHHSDVSDKHIGHGIKLVRTSSLLEQLKK